MNAWHWYTKARRIPTLIGKDAAGRRIPGGPYTAMQVIAALVTPAALWNTRALWAGQLTGLATMIAVLGLSFGVVKLLGKVDFASRNPLLVASSLFRQAFTPAGGSLAGTALRPTKTRRIRSSVLVGQLSDPTPAVNKAEADPQRQPAQADVAAEAPIAAQHARPLRVKTGPARGWGRAAPAGSADSPPPGRPVTASNGLEHHVAGGGPRRTGLEAFLSSADAKGKAA